MVRLLPSKGLRDSHSTWTTFRGAVQGQAEKPPIPLKAFRSICVSLLEDSEHAGITTLYLGHAPGNIKDGHYAAPPEKRLEKALAWLREKLLL
jgi:hypothetical protein